MSMRQATLEYETKEQSVLLSDLHALQIAEIKEIYLQGSCSIMSSSPLHNFFTHNVLQNIGLVVTGELNCLSIRGVTTETISNLVFIPLPTFFVH